MNMGNEIKIDSLLFFAIRTIGMGRHGLERYVVMLKKGRSFF